MRVVYLIGKALSLKCQEFFAYTGWRYSGLKESKTEITGQNMSVMSHLAILGHGIHLYLPGTADELGDDHWMLLNERQQDGYSINESKVR